MATARVCACDHVATMHRVTTIENANPPPKRIMTYNDCQFDRCSCLKFKQVKTVASSIVNYI
jgi:hypothetical protein